MGELPPILGDIELTPPRRPAADIAPLRPMAAAAAAGEGRNGDELAAAAAARAAAFRKLICGGRWNEIELSSDRRSNVPALGRRIDDAVLGVARERTPQRVPVESGVVAQEHRSGRLANRFRC